MTTNNTVLTLEGPNWVPAIRGNWTSSYSVCHWYGITCSPVASGVTSTIMSASNVTGVYNMTGVLPASLSQLVNLTALDLHSTLTRGPLPDLSALGKLTSLSLSGNLLGPETTASLCTLPPSLSTLQLTSNQLTEIPDCMSKCKSLTQLPSATTN